MLNLPMTDYPRPVFRIERVYDAPRELVYRAWTDPRHMARWWGPQFTSPICALDVRPGGAIRIDMRPQDGTAVTMTGIFREVVPNERLVFTAYAFQGSPDGEPGIESLSTIIFAAEGEKTRLSWEEKVISYRPDFMRAIANGDEGLRDSLERLAAYLAGGELT